ncbi:hypothetical protein Tco_0348061 [Tanacetum coccineum]
MEEVENLLDAGFNLSNLGQSHGAVESVHRLQKVDEGYRKDHFPIPFMDQMLEMTRGNQFYCFSRAFQGLRSDRAKVDVISAKLTITPTTVKGVQNSMLSSEGHKGAKESGLRSSFPDLRTLIKTKSRTWKSLDTFPLETLDRFGSYVISTPWFAVFANYHVGQLHSQGTFITTDKQGCPGFLKPLVLAVFVLRSQELHNPQLHLGIPIS